MYQKARMILLSITLLIALGMHSQVWAQAGSNNGSLKGKVRNEQGTAISGATIEAKNLDTGATVEVTSNDTGIYNLPFLSPGKYEVVVKAGGFRRDVMRMELTVGAISETDFTLSASEGEGEEHEDSLADRAKTEMSSTLTEKEIENLPIFKRDFLEFIFTTPQVTLFRSLSAKGFSRASEFSFKGQSARQNNFVVDGVDNNDLIVGTPRQEIGLPSVQEYQVITNNGSAEFRNGIGGIINAVTRGGSNEYHGDVFLFFNNQDLNAREAFLPDREQSRQYQFGSSFSGPIKKDKAFFFASFDRNTSHAANFVTLSDQLVKSAAKQNFDIQNGEVPFSFTSTAVLGRVDAQLSANNHLAVRYAYSGRYNGNFEPFGALIAESGGTKERSNSNSVTFSEVYTSPRSNLVNELRYQFARDRLNDTNNISTPLVEIIESPFKVMGFGSHVLPEFVVTQKFNQVIDNLTVAHGRNTFKMGFNYEHASRPGRVASIEDGYVQFLPFDFSAVFGIPGLPFLSATQAFDPDLRTPEQKMFLQAISVFLPVQSPGFPENVPIQDLPLPIFFVQAFGDRRTNPSTNTFGLFFQDQVRVAHNFSLTAGLRYDIERIKTGPDNSGNVSPRIGFSYSPIEKLKINASYGIFTGQIFTMRYYLAVPSFAVPSPQRAINYPLLFFPFSILPYTRPLHRFDLIQDAAGTFPADFLSIVNSGAPVLPFDITIDRKLKPPYAHEANFSVEYALNRNTVVSASYNFVRGIKVLTERYTNPVVKQFGDQVTTAIKGRLNPERGIMVALSSASDSYYHGATFAITRRFANNFSLNAHYTLSKTIDTTTDVRPDFEGQANALNLKGERGLSSQDARHRFVGSGVWDLNYTKNPFLRDFQVSSIVTVRSGQPYDLLSGVDLNLDADFPAFDRPNGLGRNVGVLPGFASVDLRVTRTVTFKERYRIQGFFEAFNLFNRTNVKKIDSVFLPNADGSFDLPARSGENNRFIAPRERFEEAFEPRQIQFGFKISF